MSSDRLTPQQQTMLDRIIEFNLHQQHIQEATTHLRFDETKRLPPYTHDQIEAALETLNGIYSPEVCAALTTCEITPTRQIENIHAEYLRQNSTESERPQRTPFDYDIAAHPAAPAHILRHIAEAYPYDNTCKLAVARNWNSDAETLRIVLRYSSSCVAMAVARHYNADTALVDHLSRRPDTRVIAARHPNIPLQRLRKFTQKNYRRFEGLCSAVASNTKADETVLSALSAHEDSHVRYSVAEHWNTPHEVLAMLMADSDNQVRTCATRFMRARKRNEYWQS